MFNFPEKNSMATPSTIVPARDWPPEYFVNPKTGETLTTTIVAFAVAINDHEVTPISYPARPRGFEPVKFTGAQFLFGDIVASSLQGMGTAIKEARAK